MEDNLKKDNLKIANIKLKSRLIVGTGKYKNFRETAHAIILIASKSYAMQDFDLHAKLKSC